MLLLSYFNTLLNVHCLASFSVLREESVYRDLRLRRIRRRLSESPATFCLLLKKKTVQEENEKKINFGSQTLSTRIY